MAKDVYALYALEIGATVIDQITDQDVGPGIQNVLLGGDANIDNTYVAIQSQDPRIRFTTTNIKDILDAAGVSGLVINQAVSTNAVKLYFRKRSGSGFAAGTNHIKMTVNSGFLYPVTADGSQDGVASITYELVCAYDGTNNPVVLEAGVAASHASTPAVAWTVGPAYINDTIVDLVQSSTITFGIIVQVVRGSGQIWAEHVSVNERAPMIDLVTTDLSWADEDSPGLGIEGILISAETRAFFRKKVSGGGNVADETAEHIQFDAAAGKVEFSRINASGRGNAAASIKIVPVATGGNAPIVVSTAAAVQGSGA